MKSEAQITQILDRLLSPTILFRILKEITTGQEWTKVIRQQTQNYSDLIKKIDIKKFEQVFKTSLSKKWIIAFSTLFNILKLR